MNRTDVMNARMPCPLPIPRQRRLLRFSSSTIDDSGRAAYGAEEVEGGVVRLNHEMGDRGILHFRRAVSCSGDDSAGDDDDKVVVEVVVEDAGIA